MSLLLNIPSYLDLNITIREGDGTSVQYPCLENPMDRGAWPSIFRWVAESHTTERLRAAVETVSDFIFGGSRITADGDRSQEIKK